MESIFLIDAETKPLLDKWKLTVALLKVWY